MANSWFRLYAEFATDPKVQMMSETNQRRLVMLFCIRCNVTETSQETSHDDEVAFQLRISDEEWRVTKELFIAKGFITEENEIVNWDKRQFVSDSSKNRTQAYRERLKQGKSNACNNVSSSKKDVTSQKRHCDAIDTDTDTDTEQITDTECKESARSQKPPSPEQTKKPKREKPIKKSFDYRTIETPDFIDNALWLDWLDTRKAEHPKSSQSESVIRGHLDTFIEIQNQGMSANAALVIAKKGGHNGCWTGIEVEWIRNRIQKSETRIAGYQPTAQATTTKPAFRDFAQEKADREKADKEKALQKYHERKNMKDAIDSTAVVVANDFNANVIGFM